MRKTYLSTDFIVALFFIVVILIILFFVLPTNTSTVTQNEQIFNDISGLNNPMTDIPDGPNANFTKIISDRTTDGAVNKEDQSAIVTYELITTDSSRLLDSRIDVDYRSKIIDKMTIIGNPPDGYLNETQYYFTNKNYTCIPEQITDNVPCDHDYYCSNEGGAQGITLPTNNSVNKYLNCIEISDPIVLPNIGSYKSRVCFNYTGNQEDSIYLTVIDDTATVVPNDFLLIDSFSDTIYTDTNVPNIYAYRGLMCKLGKFTPSNLTGVYTVFDIERYTYNGKPSSGNPNYSRNENGQFMAISATLTTKLNGKDVTDKYYLTVRSIDATNDKNTNIINQIPLLYTSFAHDIPFNIKSGVPIKQELQTKFALIDSLYHQINGLPISSQLVDTTFKALQSLVPKSILDNLVTDNPPLVTEKLKNAFIEIESFIEKTTTGSITDPALLSILNGVNLLYFIKRDDMVNMELNETFKQKDSINEYAIPKWVLIPEMYNIPYNTFMPQLIGYICNDNPDYSSLTSGSQSDPNDQADNISKFINANSIQIPNLYRTFFKYIQNLTDSPPTNVYDWNFDSIKYIPNPPGVTLADIFTLAFCPLFPVGPPVGPPDNSKTPPGTLNISPNYLSGGYTETYNYYNNSKLRLLSKFTNNDAVFLDSNLGILNIPNILFHRANLITPRNTGKFAAIPKGINNNKPFFHQLIDVRREFNYYTKTVGPPIISSDGQGNQFYINMGQVPDPIIDIAF